MQIDKRIKSQEACERTYSVRLAICMRMRDVPGIVNIAQPPKKSEKASAFKVADIKISLSDGRRRSRFFKIIKRKSVFRSLQTTESQGNGVSRLVCVWRIKSDGPLGNVAQDEWRSRKIHRCSRADLS
jgi:hypothetical protein